MDELTQVEYAEWLRWCGYVDAELYTNPLDNDPDYLAGFAERYSELECEGHKMHEDCHYCGKELLITNHTICPECAEMRILDMARENITLLAEIVVGEYVANMDDYLDKILYAWESNDSDKAFDAILDAFSGAVLKAMEDKL